MELDFRAITFGLACLLAGASGLAAIAIKTLMNEIRALTDERDALYELKNQYLDELMDLQRKQ